MNFDLFLIRHLYYLSGLNWKMLQIVVLEVEFSMSPVSRENIVSMCRSSKGSCEGEVDLNMSLS